MAKQDHSDSSQASRLLPCYVKPDNDGLMCSAIMLCEMIGDEIQSISLRVAADVLAQWQSLGIEPSAESL